MRLVSSPPWNTGRLKSGAGCPTSGLELCTAPDQYGSTRYPNSTLATSTNTAGVQDCCSVFSESRYDMGRGFAQWLGSSGIGRRACRVELGEAARWALVGRGDER